mgnify:CR=1 FL=1
MMLTGICLIVALIVLWAAVAVRVRLIEKAYERDADALREAMEEDEW